MTKPQCKPIRVAIVGSRQFRGTVAAGRFIDRCLARCGLDQIEIVSGCALGADRYGAGYAKQRNLPCREFPADWKQNGRRAGYLRNQEMANYVTHVIAFWDGKSPGTAHMIQLAQQRGLSVRVWNTTVQKHDRSYFH